MMNKQCPYLAAVPKQLQVNLSPPSSSAIEPGSHVTQQIMVNNPSQIPLKMKLRISYKFNSQPVHADALVSNFPPQAWQ